MFTVLFQMKSSIKLIKEHPRTADSLLNALRYVVHDCGCGHKIIEVGVV